MAKSHIRRAVGVPSTGVGVTPGESNAHAVRNEPPAPADVDEDEGSTHIDHGTRTTSSSTAPATTVPPTTTTTDRRRARKTATKTASKKGAKRR